MKKVIDVSNLNGMGYRTLPDYQSADGLIVQAIPRPRPNGIVAQQLYAGRDDGKALGIYSWLWHDPNWRMDPDVTVDQQIRLATVPNDIELRIRPMLDEEDNQSDGWQAVSVQQRKDDVLRALDTLDTFAAKRGVPPAGIYWSDFYIHLLFDGDPSFLDGRVQWKADYGPNPHPNPGVILGGAVVGHQYTSRPIDMSMFADSELTQEVAVQIPQSYIDKFHLAGPEDVDGLIANFEGVISTTRSIALAEGEAAALDCDSRLERIKQVLAS